MHCPHYDAAASLVASSSGSRIGPSFCNTRSLIVKGPCVFEIPVGGCGVFGKFLPHTYTIRMYSRGVGESHTREEKKKWRIWGQGRTGVPRRRT